MKTKLIEILQSKYPEYCMKHYDTADEIIRLLGNMKIAYQCLDCKEVVNQRIVDFDLHQDDDGQELQIYLENGKQIEISFNSTENEIMVQSD